MTTSSALKTLYASGGSDIRIATLSIRCSEWADDVHLAQSWQDVTATLETGETVTFMAADFAAQLAKKAAEGQQSLNFVIDPGESDAMARLDAARDAGARIYLDYREYLATNLSAPARPVETMNAISYSFTPLASGDSQLSLIASFYDLTNKKWPTRRFTAKLAPGLKNYG